jgi:hypothetical protein
MPKHKPGGNGSGKFNVHTVDMGGWARIFTDDMIAAPENLGQCLSHALTEWLRQRPQFRMRCVVPIVKDGATAELHMWYDLQVFPDLSGAQPTTPN